MGKSVKTKDLLIKLIDQVGEEEFTTFEIKRVYFDLHHLPEDSSIQVDTTQITRDLKKILSEFFNVDETSRIKRYQILCEKFVASGMINKYYEAIEKKATEKKSKNIAILEKKLAMLNGVKTYLTYLPCNDKTYTKISHKPINSTYRNNWVEYGKKYGLNLEFFQDKDLTTGIRNVVWNVFDKEEQLTLISKKIAEIQAQLPEDIKKMDPREDTKDLFNEQVRDLIRASKGLFCSESDENLINSIISFNLKTQNKGTRKELLKELAKLGIYKSNREIKDFVKDFKLLFNSHDGKINLRDDVYHGLIGKKVSFEISPEKPTSKDAKVEETKALEKIIKKVEENVEEEKPQPQPQPEKQYLFKDPIYVKFNSEEELINNLGNTKIQISRDMENIFCLENIEKNSENLLSLHSLMINFMKREDEEGFVGDKKAHISELIINTLKEAIEKGLK